jgi:putative nucleotidyltransferase-like protein
VNRTAQAPNTREWTFLLGALSKYFREPGSSGSLAVMAERVDWNSLLQIAGNHGVSSLLHQALSHHKDFVPLSSMNLLENAYQRNVRRTLFLTGELVRVLDCVDSLQVDAIPYKGVVLSEIYYGDMAMRQSGDIDLFVRPENVGEIKEAVRHLGYTPRGGTPRFEAAYLASGYECTFDSAAGKNLLELHWALQPRFYAVDFDMTGLFRRAVSIRVAGRNMKTPCAEDLLIVLSLHAAKHAWEKLIWLCDIAQIMRRENVRWEEVQARSGDLGIERILHITLLLVNRLLAIELPPTIQSVVGDDRAGQNLAEEIALSLSSGDFCDEEKLSYFRLMMRLRERPRDRLRFLWRLTFTPGPGEWEAVHLPKWLSPFYRVVRLARLASRFARR